MAVCRRERGAGQAVVRLSGAVDFRGMQIASAATGGDTARVTGSGWLNGKDGYRFMLEAVAKAASTAGVDRLRVRITHADPATGADVVDYDNGAPGPDRTAVAHGGLTLRR